MAILKEKLSKLSQKLSLIVKTDCGVNCEFLPISSYIALTMFFTVKPLGNTALQSFDRRTGGGIAAGYDSARAYHNLMLYLLGILFVTGMLLVFFQWCGSKKKQGWLHSADRIGSYLIWPLLLDYIGVFVRANSNQNNDLPYFSKVFLMMLVLEFLLDALWKSVPRKCDVTALLNRMCVGMCAGMVGAYVLDMSNKWVWVLVYSLAYVLTYALEGTRLENVGIYWVWTPVLMTLCVECFYILNQWDVYIVSQRKVGWFLVAGMLAACVLLCIKCPVKAIAGSKKEWVLCLGLFTAFTCVAFRPLLCNTAVWGNGDNLFELANITHMSDGLLNWGKIPLIETFSAHMLRDMIPSLLWAGANGTSVSVGIYGLWLNGFTRVTLFCLLCFYVRPFVAFIVLAGLPCMEGPWNIAPLAILVLFLVIKKQSMPRYLVYWSALACCLLYQLDTGLMFGLSSILALLALHITRRIKLDWKRFFAGAIAVSGCIFTVFGVVCWKKGISPVSRIMEFLDVTLMSNPIWAYAKIGEPENAAMFWTYIAMPITAMLAIVWLVFHSQKLSQLSSIKWAGLITLFTAVLVNMNRTMVRHNLLEGVNIIMQSTIVLAVALLVYELKGRKTMLFLGVLAFSTAIIPVLSSGNIVQYQKSTIIANQAQQSMNDMLLPVHQEAKRAERVKFEPDLEQEMQKVKAVMDSLLEPDESYVDFSNQSSLYAITGRESPFYLSEVPGLLSGEYSQQCYIEQIEENEDKLPLLLTAGDLSKELNFGIDGVELNTRYYKIVEYLCQKYRPVFKWENYAVWARIDCYNDILSKVQNWGENAPVAYELCDYTNSTAQPAYNYHWLALIWAELDEKHAIDNEVLLNCEKNADGFYAAKIADDQKADGNYLKISVEAAEDTLAELLLSDANGQMLCRFTLQLQQGQHDYLIRVSQYPGWYSQEVCWASFGSALPVNVQSMQILRGD